MSRWGCKVTMVTLALPGKYSLRIIRKGEASTCSSQLILERPKNVCVGKALHEVDELGCSLVARVEIGLEYAGTKRRHCTKNLFLFIKHRVTNKYTAVDRLDSFVMH